MVSWVPDSTAGQTLCSRQRFKPAPQISLHLFLCSWPFLGICCCNGYLLPIKYLPMKKTLPFAHPFTRFVVCPKCWNIYHYGECVVISGSHRSSKVCNYVRYPNHPYRSGRRECAHPLLKSVSLVSGRKRLYPFKVYCYKSLQSSLQELLLRPGFHESCQ